MGAALDNFNREPNLSAIDNGNDGAGHPFPECSVDHSWIRISDSTKIEYQCSHGPRPIPVPKQGQIRFVGDLETVVHRNRNSVREVWECGNCYNHGDIYTRIINTVNVISAKYL